MGTCYPQLVSSVDDSDAESSEDELDVLSDEIPFSPSKDTEVSLMVGLFKYQCMILAVRVSIIF